MRYYLVGAMNIIKILFLFVLVFSTKLFSLEITVYVPIYEPLSKTISTPIPGSSSITIDRKDLEKYENTPIQKIDSTLYNSVSKLIGNLKSQEYDGHEAKIKTALVGMLTELTSSLLKTRLEKAILNNTDHSALLDEEKYILNSQEEMIERKEVILSGILNGKAKLLESIIQNNKTKLIAVRFLEEVEELAGADAKKYGPFKPEDIATLPYENAQNLISKNIAVKIHWENQ